MPEGAYAKNRQSKKGEIARMGCRASVSKRIEKNNGELCRKKSKNVEKILLGRGQVCVEVKNTCAKAQVFLSKYVCKHKYIFVVKTF
jgi:hypothetical protein